MSIGYGYGSEWHLLRWMGRHRQEFDQRVLAAIGHGKAQLDWLDCTLAPGATWLDAEIKGLDFLPAGDSVRARWEQEWPQTGNVPNWDAVGRLHGDGSTDWLLVEAKAHIGELKSSCGAKKNGGLLLIEKFLDEAKQALGVPASHDWLKGHYQLANRVANLHFLRANGISARLLLLYFTGDHRPGWRCPKDQQEWQPALQKAKAHLGLPSGHGLASRIHELYLPVA